MSNPTFSNSLKSHGQIQITKNLDQKDFRIFKQ